MFEELFKMFDQHNESLYLVGGFVRDFLSAQDSDFLWESAYKIDPNSVPKRFALATEYFWGDVESGKIDIDFATSALPEKTIQILKESGLKVIPIGKEFGTIQTFWKDKKIEITTFRCDESYKKGSRKPSVKFGKTIEEDLARRDFTINAIAMDKDGKIIDPFMGHNDLIEGLLWSPDRNYGNSKENPSMAAFTDDPLRMLRAYRFEARGIAQCSWQVGEAIEKLKKEIHMVSAERIFDEFSKILMSKYAHEALDHMAKSGLLGEVFPELQRVIDFKQNQGKWHSKLVWPHTLGVVQQSPQILEVKWSALFHDIAKPLTYSESPDGVHFYGHDWKGSLVWDEVAHRLRMSNEFRDYVHFLIYEHLQPSLLSSEGVNHASNKALRRLMFRAGDKLDNLFHLSLADITSHRPDIVAERRANCLALWARCKKLAEEQQIIRIKLPKGTGLIVANALGINPGKKLGEVMAKLEQMLIDGEISIDSDFAQVAKNISAKS